MRKTPDITAERQAELLAKLETLAAERAEVENTLSRNRVARQNAANESYHAQRDGEVRRNSQTRDRLEKQLRHAVSEARHVHSQALTELEREEAAFEKSAPQEHEQRLQKLERDADVRQERCDQVLQQGTARLKQQWIAFEQRWQQAEAGQQQAAEELQKEAKRRGVAVPAGDRELAELEGGGPLLAVSASAVQESAETLESLRDVQSAKFFDEGWTVLLMIFTCLGVVYPAGSVFGWGDWRWAATTVAVAIALTAAIRAACRWHVRRTAEDMLPSAAHLLDASVHALNQARGLATNAAESKRSEIKQQHATDLVAIAAELDRKQQDEMARYNELVAETRDALAARKSSLQDQLQQRLTETHQRFDPLRQREEQRHKETMQRLAEENRAQIENAQRAYDQGMQGLVERWTKGLESFHREIDAMNEYCRGHFPAWDQIDWKTWQPPAAPAAAFPYGRYVMDVNDYGEAPRDKRLQLQASRFELPAALTFPERPSLLLEASDDGKAVAVSAIQTLMLRMLTAIPPGKVRFTIIDAEALGQSFSAFMHLADFDEQAVGSRIWTEPQHIQQQLTDLTEHTENVIQKYLRNEFASIEEYNQHAGEVAEPYRILVVANFPEGFTDDAVKRLVSIANTGAKCGVFTLISIDSRKKLPRDFFVDDLAASATSLQWTHHGFRPRTPQLKALPLEMDGPPAENLFAEALRVIGRHLQEADNVEVPFQLVAPDALWQGDCSEELDVALGRAGATKLQHLRLGRGVSQHVLISGKTGSGKSTLLHALITNMALHYSPSQVEFYLIDFKKGVEFKPYAAHHLPHARVIAIESEREFGMSVLERLDEELRLRGDLFREANVQDLAGFRRADSQRPMPRVLLIIDEFQELFVKDDKIASESALLLDRLVRQGRAFGMHVLLGSQTLAGGYSLPRSTIGQMAVRIALQCSESDAHLILSEDNTAARLLNRPGEAIYNNANGRFEGNSPFQVVFLADSERVEELQRIAALAEETADEETAGGRRPAPIVFEGNVPADPLRTPELLAQLEAVTPQPTPRAWLGSAVAIKPPTSTEFAPQAGANLLVVGPQEDMALGVLAAASVGLAGGNDESVVHVLDGGRPESPYAATWQSLADAWPGVQTHTTAETAELLQTLDAERQRREAQQDESAAPHFLVLHNLARLRDLRRTEDDYSFSFSDDSGEASASSPDKLLQGLLRDGPSWGLHVLVWADSFNTATRWFDRQSMKDFEQRVLFQMTAADSANLMDSPAAAQLGTHRAILYTEEQGRQEKFRPFAPPDQAWLRWLRQRAPTRQSS